jgi:hypothetical protein
MHPLGSIGVYTLVVVAMFMVAIHFSHFMLGRLDDLPIVYRRLPFAIPLFVAFSVIGVIVMRVAHFIGIETLFHLMVGTYLIDNDPELIDDLTGVEYGYAQKNGRDAIQLESKADMRKRGLASPDNGDALALTFAYPVAPSDHTFEFSSSGKHEWDYDPFALPDVPAVAPSPQPYYEASPSRFGYGRCHPWYDK